MDIPATGEWQKPDGDLPQLPVAKTVEQMRHPDFIDALNSVLVEPAWKVDLTPNINNGFPILLWQTEGIPNGIKQIKPISSVNASVNVVNGILTIDADGFRKASIYDISGKKMLETQQSSISVSQFPQGVYIIGIQTGNGVCRQKILIKGFF